MEKKKVSIQLEGRNYAVITSEDEGYVKEVAESVTQSIRRASQMGKNLDTRDCAVLAALDFCDDLNKAKRKNKEIVDKADQIIRQSAELQKKCTEYKEKLSACTDRIGELEADNQEYKEKLADSINENTRNVKRMKMLEQQLANLVKENDMLKKTSDGKKQAEEKRKFDENVRVKKNEKLMGYVPMRQCSLFDDENDKKD